MSEADIPASVLTFIAKRIDSVPQLESLLIMSADENRTWTVDEIAARTYVSANSAAAVLSELHRRQLVVLAEDGQRYQFFPASEEERQIVAQTALAYRRHLIPLATYIHSKASASIKEFARAFALKKDTD
jgi:DNA-binding transcriptional regulator GbsR (MarR family)